MSINCTINLPDGRQSGFWVQPNCRLAKLKSNCLEQLGYEITKVSVRKQRSKEQRELVGDDLYLIEDHLLEAQDIIILDGHQVKKGKGIADAINLTATIVYKTNPQAKIDPPAAVQLPVQVRNGSLLRHLLTIFQRDHDLVPDTIELFDATGTKKLNLTHTPEQAGLKEGGTFQVHGLWFPISLFKGAEFAANEGLRFSSECVVCLEPLTSKPVRVFEPCGHAVVCRDCPCEICPLCRK